jgi:hypothetical protein
MAQIDPVIGAVRSDRVLCHQTFVGPISGRDARAATAEAAKTQKRKSANASF